MSPRLSIRDITVSIFVINCSVLSVLAISEYFSDKSVNSLCISFRISSMKFMSWFNVVGFRAAVGW